MASSILRPYVIERGTSGGISYIKYPDGTLMCIGGGSSYISANSEKNESYAFPVTFASAPNGQATLSVNPNDESQTGNGLVFLRADTTQCYVKVRNLEASQKPFWWSWLVTGRWK